MKNESRIKNPHQDPNESESSFAHTSESSSYPVDNQVAKNAKINYDNNTNHNKYDLRKQKKQQFNKADRKAPSNVKLSKFGNDNIEIYRNSHLSS